MSVYKGNPTKDGRCWYFRIYKDGKQYESKKFMTKQEAKEQESLMLLEKKSLSKHKFNIVSISYFKALEQAKKESTVYCYKKDYKNHIEPYFNKNIEDISMSDINGWFEYMENKNLSVGFMNKVYCVLKCILDYGIKNQYIKTNLLTIHGRFQEKNDKVVNDEDKIKYITKEEFDKFISVIDIPLWKTFFTFAYYTGCRKGEMLALNWNDINFDTNEININKTLYSKVKGKLLITSTKTNKNRKIKMSRTLKDSMLEYKKEVSKYTDFNENWFVFGNTEFLKLSNIDRYKHKYFELSGVHEITMHEFRHSHVSLLINEYIKSGQTDTAKFFLMMSNRMGHTVDTMTSVYMHLFPTIQDEIVDLLDNI